MPDIKLQSLCVMCKLAPWPVLEKHLVLDLCVLGFPGGASDKEPTCQCRRHRDAGSIFGSGRSPGGGHGNPLQYCCLENPYGKRSLAVHSPSDMSVAT